MSPTNDDHSQCSAPRFDLYAPIHKAVRLFMSDTVARLGRVDAADSADLQSALSQAQSLLALMRSHVQHENDFVHPAIEARCPSASLRIASEHVAHVEEIDALEDEIDELQAAAAAERADRIHRLYRRFALFCADNLLHMDSEETVHNDALWSAYSDAELRELDRRIEAQVPPDEKLLWLRWISGSASLPALTTLLNGMRGSVPPETLDAVLDVVRAQLDEPRWMRLSGSLCLSPDAVGSAA